MTYDALLRLDRITYHNGQTTGVFKLFSDFRYTRDAYGNISSARRMDGTKNLYGYNPAGEVVADRKLRTAAGNEFLRGQSYRWSYDGIGNRLSASAGGDENGQNLRVSSYTPNALNQYAAIQNPGAADVIGVADGQAAVTINGVSATRQGDWFHGEVTSDNSSGPVWQTTSVSDGTDSNAGALLIPPASQSPQHDLDGNLTSDGVHGYSWDGENRLIKIETLPAAVSAGVPYRRVEMAYDSQWRRIRRERFDQASTTTPVETTRYLWAGWRCLADLGATDSIGKGYVWGLDQAHQLHLGDSNNALLWTHDVIRNERHFCHYDGNGNVTGLSDAAGNHTAEYFYNAFGEINGKRGSYVDENDYRFSTKPFEKTGGLYYYGYRYYHPVSGRWRSRDPIGEFGGFNLHASVNNDLVSGFDTLGLFPLQVIGLMEAAPQIIAGSVDIMVGIIDGAMAGATAPYSTADESLRLWAESNYASRKAAKSGFNSVCRSGESIAARNGREAHQLLRDWADANKGRGWIGEGRVQGISGRWYVPDITTPSGNFIDLKPLTPSGIISGYRKARIYSKEFPKKRLGSFTIFLGNEKRSSKMQQDSQTIGFREEGPTLESQAGRLH